MGELLLELLSEEIPARMQRRAIDDLVTLVRAKLAAAEIPAASLKGYVTPRRLTVIAGGIPERQPDRSEERRGPRVGAPQPALDGFLRAAGLQSIEECEIRDIGRGEFYFARMERPGAPTGIVLLQLLPAVIAELPWLKSMRYPASSLRWVRPLTSVLCLFDDAIVRFSLGGIWAGQTTRGHRFMSDGEITIDDAGDYREKLEAAHVILDPNRRREMIAAELNRLAAAEGLAVKPDPALLDEVTGLVEYPVVLMGRIDEEFVRPLPEGLPPEVLATAMRTHQKYFSCLKPEPAPTKAGGTLGPRFLFVANNRAADDGRTIIAGNERVLRARLADARFFWDQDRKVRLEDRVEALKERLYYEKLGSVFDKVERIRRLAGFLAKQVHSTVSPALTLPSAASGGGLGRGDPSLYRDDDPEVGRLAKRAAQLAKADLSTGMVGEFPELQGVMGRYYALHDGEDPRVADAIADHYKPLGPSDTCPTAPTSVVVALADKIDALAAFFAIGEPPTGSRDPFALRRAALGAIRLILENGLRLPLAHCFATAVVNLGAGILENAPEQGSATDLLLAFIADRLKVHLREQGARHDFVAAVFSLGEDDLVRLLARVSALEVFLASDDGANLLIAYRRAANIVAIEERRDGRSYDDRDDANLLRQQEEKTLSAALGEIGGNAGKFVIREKFADAMAALALLRQPVDAFFDAVTVNTDDPALRENRLRLLSRIRAVMNQVADFSQIEG
ncbi:MAG TPA: glycine--tRNA ligase subunit beta [Stellaceae bacterium]|nr:glycine--tRNA ligase subunit beta [Stellaceae bacterium]